MFYPRFTKVIVNHFMSQDKSISRRNKVDWHMANDDPILTTMRFIPQHEVVQRYGAILPDLSTISLTTTSEAYKTYHDLATGKVQPKPKYVRRSSRSKTEQAPKPSTGKRVKATAKIAKSGKKKQPAPGLETLSDIALTEAEQMKIATNRSLIQTHSSYTSGSGAHEGTDVTLGVPDVPTYESDDEEIYWKTSSDDNKGDDDAANDDHDDADNDSERTESDNEENVDVAQSEYTEEEEVNVKHTYEEEDENDLYSDLNSIMEREENADIDRMHLNNSSFSEFIQTNQYATALSSIPNIVDNYLGSKLKEAVDVVVQLKSDRIREEAQAENEDFLNKLADNIKKIIKDQVKEQVKA
ncbi:hypothetical protein Tco_1402987 [Tanacetum coccineum]